MPYQIFKGVYETFAEVDGSLTVFSGDRWTTRDAERLDAALLAAKAPCESYLLGPILATMLAERKSLAVLDYGGGPGISYPEVRAMLLSVADLRYHVIDNPALCALGRSRFSAESALTFHESHDTLAEHYDLIHLGSMIQYIDDFSSWLKFLSTKDPEHILISEAMTGSRRTFVTQASYYGATHPFRFFSLEDLCDEFSRIGYVPTLRIPYLASIRGVREFYDMSNLPEDCRIAHPLHLLFTRR